MPEVAVTIRPVERDEQQHRENTCRASFITYRNYLLSCSHLSEYIYPDLSLLKMALKESDRYQVKNIERIKKLLFNAWNTELLLNLPSQFSKDFKKFSNHWSPVQSYYAVYLALRAFIVAKHPEAKGDHATTLKFVAINLIRDQALFPTPWNVLKHKDTYINTSNIKVETVNALENPQWNDASKLWGSYLMFVGTTHNRLCQEQCEKWKKEHPNINGTTRKKLPPGKKQEIFEWQRPVSFFDCLYRLRIRSNYKDADIFLLGAQEDEVQEYFESLCKLTNKLLFCIEHYLCCYL
ncbi:MAG: hypothetical protein ABH833_03145, partial [Parcubacteria group bacterium]